MSGKSPHSGEHGVRLVRREEISQGGAVELVARLVAALTHAPTGVDAMTAHSVELAAGGSLPPACLTADESVICVISGEAMIHWGDSLEFSAIAGPGDLLIVPPGLPHQLHAPKRCRIYFLAS
ncbi:MAG: hypothetical protein FJ170_05995 [Gammaproteobacteria bacterium]|nr:hypothetical protein [Gammaproteobacteria bacterium]